MGVFTGEARPTKENFTFENNEVMGKQFPKHTILRMKTNEQTNEDNTLSQLTVLTHDSIDSLTGYTTV